MLESQRERLERITQRANEKFAKADEWKAEFRHIRQNERDADTAETARLRALRLAKEASDGETRIVGKPISAQDTNHNERSAPALAT
jgi:hypothetical protein